MEADLRRKVRSDLREEQEAEMNLLLKNKEDESKAAKGKLNQQVQEKETLLKKQTEQNSLLESKIISAEKLQRNLFVHLNQELNYATEDKWENRKNTSPTHSRSP